jgi:hypothetical protein
VELVPVVFEDGAADAVRDELLALNGVLVWVNPIQDGANRRNLDTVLVDAASHGVWVSANPAVILKLGTKEVMFSTRNVGWGGDTDLYRTPGEFTQRFTSWLGERGRAVVKQGRGNGGNGVWKVELLDAEATAGSHAAVRVQEARSRDGSSETTSLGAFVARCEEYFAWSGCLVAQAFQERLVEGMIPDWVPEMTDVLGIDRQSLPVVWDADFLYGPKTSPGEDTYVLCEINVSAVWPFPPMAAGAIAAAAFARARESTIGRG